jgi:serine protease Do
LKALQSRVKGVVDKCSDATVGVLIGMGAGSGVIVSEDGLVLTAAHVSGEPGRTCKIVLPDGKMLKARTLGFNEKLDNGMIQIVDKGPNDGKWPFLKVGKSADLKKGQWLVSLGHPGGWQKGRPPVARLGQVRQSTKSTIQTSCTLVGGDSGGPLFDLEGNVVGIHSRIGYTLETNIHVPADVFTSAWTQMVRGEDLGKPAKPATASFGVQFDDDPKVARLEVIVPEDGPAARAGLKPGDIITEFDGREVSSPENIRAVLRKRKPDDEVVVKLKRGSRNYEMVVVLGKPGS